MRKSHIYLFLLIAFILFIFKDWFLPGVISSGDLRIFYPSSFGDYYFHPFAWDWQQANGLGGFEPPFAWFYYELTIPLIMGKTLGLNWQVIEKTFFLSPFLIVGFVSSLYFIKNLFPRNPFYLLGPMIYLLNTYIFMMVGGGQIVGISMAYAVFPFVFIQFKKITDSQSYIKTINASLIAGLLFTLLIFFDLRFAYMLAFIVVLYFLFTGWKNLRKILFVFLSLIIAGLLHAFWVLPVLLSHQNPAESLGSAFSSLQSVRYFSFAKFENSISLLHPNWPENIFGKVSFMKPEFLVIPILAYASLLFLNSKFKIQKSKAQVRSQKLYSSYSSSEQSESRSDFGQARMTSSRPDMPTVRQARIIIYFSLLGLLGAFLAKGANDPFGGLYLWMFGHIPGFVMFRDPTKWYTLVALSYSVLIPFSVWKISQRVSSMKYKVSREYGTAMIIIVFVLFWLFTIRQSVFGQLGGTFKATSIPPEYVLFANYLTDDQQFSRTLWVPTIQRFGYSSAHHPAVSAENLFNLYDEKSLIKKLRQPDTMKLLQGSGVKYVIVPADSQEEIFVKDHTYSPQLYNQTVADVSKIPWLKSFEQINNLEVFSVPNPKDHFWVDDERAKVSYKAVSPVEYIVSVSSVKKGDRLVFAESYDPHWIATIGAHPHFSEASRGKQVASSKYNGLLNSFVLPKSGNYTMDIYYTPQKWVNVGIVISLVSFILIVGSLVLFRLKIKY